MSMKFFETIKPSEYSKEDMSKKIINLEKMVDALLCYIQQRDHVHIRYMEVPDDYGTKIVLNVYPETDKL